MTKKDLITLISQESNLSKKESYLAIEAVMKTITYELIKENTVTLLGFRYFSTKYRPARQGNPPQTGKYLLIPATNAVILTG